MNGDSADSSMQCDTELFDTLAYQDFIDDTPTKTVKASPPQSAPTRNTSTSDDPSPSLTLTKSTQWIDAPSPSHSFSFGDKRGSYLGHAKDSPDDSTPPSTSDEADVFDDSFSPTDGSFMANIPYFDPRSLSTIAEVSREDISRQFDNYLQNGVRKAKTAAPPSLAAEESSSSLSFRLRAVADQSLLQGSNALLKRRSWGKEVSEKEYIRLLLSQDAQIGRMVDKISVLEQELEVLRRHGDGGHNSGSKETSVAGGEQESSASVEEDQLAITLNDKGPISGDVVEPTSGDSTGKRYNNDLAPERDTDTTGDVQPTDPSHDLAEHTAHQQTVEDATAQTPPYDLTAELRGTRHELDAAVAETEQLRLELRQATKRYDGLCRQWDKERQETKEELDNARRTEAELQGQIRELHLGSAAVCRPRRNTLTHSSRV